MRKLGRYFKKTGFILLLICLFALFIRLLCFYALRPWDEEVAENRFLAVGVSEYQQWTASIIESRSFSGLSSGRETPGYPLFIAFIYLLFGVKPWIVLFIQILLDVGILLMSYFIAKEIFKSEPISLITAFLYSISFPSAYYSVTYRTETLFTLFLTLSVLIFIKSLKKNAVWGFALAGFLIGLAALTRPLAQYFFLVVVITLSFNNNKRVQKLRNALLLIIVFLVTISPWQIRNLRAHGHYALSSCGGLQLCLHNVSTIVAYTEKISFREAQEELVGDSVKGISHPFERDKIYRKIAISYILKHPLQFGKYTLRGMVRLFLGPARSGMLDLLGIEMEPPIAKRSLFYYAYKIIKNLRYEFPLLILIITQVVEYIFVLIGLAVAFVKEKKFLFPLFLMMAIFYFAIFIGSDGYSRFRVPIIPLYLVISAKGMFETFKFVRNRTSQK